MVVYKKYELRYGQNLSLKDEIFLSYPKHIFFFWISNNFNK